MLHLRALRLLFTGGLFLFLACWKAPPEGEEPLEMSAEESSEVLPAESLSVLYFKNMVDPQDEEHLGQMLSNLLTAELARTEDLKVLTPQQLYSAARQFGGVEPGNRDRALVIARNLELDKMILGQVTHGAQRLMVEAEMVEVESGHVLATRRVEGQSLSQLFTVAQSLGQQMYEALETAVPVAPPERPLTADLTSSVDAYRAFVVGDSLLHRLAFAEAIEVLQEAVVLDPQFAMAYYRLSTAAAWLGDQEQAQRNALKAVELGKNLAPSQRNLFEAALLFQEGRLSELLNRVEALLVENPENKEALLYIAESYLHSGAEAHPARATEAMLMLDALDPQFRLLGNHLVLALVIQGRWEEAFSYLDAWVAAEPEKEDLRAVALALGNRLDEVPELPRPLVRVNDNYRSSIFMLQNRWQQAGEILLQDIGVGYQRSWRLRNRATFLTYLGDFEAAVATYRESSHLRAQMGDEGIQNGLPASSHAGLAQLLWLRGDFTHARQQVAEAIELQPRRLALRYYAGRLARLDGDVEAIEKHLRALRQITADSRGSMAPLFEEALEAELDLAEGHAEHARAKYENVVMSGILLHDFYVAASSSGAVFRSGLASACRALWDQACEAEALHGLLESGFERVHHPVLYVRALFRLGELHLELDEEEQANHYFELFLEHWGDTTWPLPEIAAARDHLTR